MPRIDGARAAPEPRARRRRPRRRVRPARPSSASSSARGQDALGGRASSSTTSGISKPWRVTPPCVERLLHALVDQAFVGRVLVDDDDAVGRLGNDIGAVQLRPRRAERVVIRDRRPCRCRAAPAGASRRRRSAEDRVEATACGAVRLSAASGQVIVERPIFAAEWAYARRRPSRDAAGTRMAPRAAVGRRRRGPMPGIAPACA